MLERFFLTPPSTALEPNGLNLRPCSHRFSQRLSGVTQRARPPPPDQVQTIPPRIDTLDTKVKTMQGQLMDTEQRLNDTKLQIDQVSKTIQKQATGQRDGCACAGVFGFAVSSCVALESELCCVRSLRDLP